MSDAESRACAAAETQFAQDFPDCAVCKVVLAAAEPERIVVRVFFEPRRGRLMPTPYRLYAVSAAGAICRRLEGAEAVPYLLGPRK